MYTQDSIERVKEAVDMVALVGARTDLRRVGSRYTGLCPFHDERTPSFSVDAEHKLYHCFGCGVGGDAISFVRETEGRDFSEAIELLAERTGVQLERAEEDPRADERRQRRQRLYALLDRTAGFYAAYLWQSPEASRARDYLLGRGLDEQVLSDFRVGLSPEGLGPRAHERPAPGLQRAGAGGRRPGPARPRRGRLRPLPRPDHVPAGRRARARGGLRGARARETATGTAPST